MTAKRKIYRPSRMWVVVATNCNTTTLASSALGIAEGDDQGSEKLYGTHFVACFRTRKAAKDAVKDRADWDGIEVREVIS